MKLFLSLILLVLVCSSSVRAQSQIDEALKFYPLETGNYWEYQSINDDYIYGLDTSIFTIKVIGDTLMPNGQVYKMLLKNFIDENYMYTFFQRVDSITANVYEYNDNEILIDSLMAQVNDTSKAARSRDRLSERMDRTLCTKISNDTILGQLFTIKSFQHLLPPIDWSYNLAQGLGYIGDEICEGTCSWEVLTYAEIGENSYGRKVTSLDGIENMRHKSFVLYPNYPNPFNPSTKIRFTVNEPGKTSLIVFNLLGEKVAGLLNEYKMPGTYVIKFNAGNLSSGMYYYRLKTSAKTETRKMLLIR